jgi:hypothetical protein
MSVLTWKPKVTPRNRLLFQLAVSKLPTKETESGSSEKDFTMWGTPSTMDWLPARSKEECSTNQKNREGRSRSGNLREQVEHKNMWPTPRATERMGYYEQPSPSMIKGTHGWSLPAAVTDEASEEPHRMWPTPTTMDTKEDSLKHATKMLQGKTHRSSGQPIQKTLADKVMMEEIIKNPELMELYQDHQMMERPHLPEQQEFVAYLRSQTTMKELAEKTDIKKTTIEHWFRKDTKGFSHPSIEDWEAIKPHLKELKYDKEITTVKSIEWENQKILWPTPRSSKIMNMTMESALNRIKNTGYHSNLEEKVALEEQKMWPTPNASPATASQTVEATQKLTASRDRKQGVLIEAVVDRMWPTPNASDNRDRGNMSDPAIQRRIAMGKQVGLTMAVKDKPGKGTLNPDWVEWLMGYPQGWTDISDSSENPASQE